MNKVPKLRFKEFSEEWEEKRLGEVSEIIMGQSPSSSKYNENFNGLPLIQGNADCKNRKVFPRIYTTEITKESFPNDIIMTVRSPVGAISLSNIHSCIGRGVCAIRNASNFIYHYLIKLEDSWDKLAQGSTFTAVNSNNIKNLKINLPLLQEQEKIADFLSSVDKKISIIEEKLDLFKDYKKGIMQKIFKQELRFKDSNGNDYPEWEEKNFQQLVLLQRGSSPRPIVKYITTSSDGVNWIKIGDTNKENRFITSTSEKITKEGAKKSREVKKGEIILSNSMSYGRPFILKIDGYIHDGWFVLRNYEENLNKEFLCQLLGSEIVQKQYKKLAAGGVVENISSELVNAVNIELPCLEEQQKIADFLSSIDNKIDNLAAELEDLKEFKKGLLQQMFI